MIHRHVRSRLPTQVRTRKRVDNGIRFLSRWLANNFRIAENTDEADHVSQADYVPGLMRCAAKLNPSTDSNSPMTSVSSILLGTSDLRSRNGWNTADERALQAPVR